MEGVQEDVKLSNTAYILLESLKKTRKITEV